jgi:predicted peroxiredoxin
VRRLTRNLTIFVAEASEPRLCSALVMALATRALGHEARLFFDSAAVAALAAPSEETAVLIDEALTAGAALILCQSGLAAAGLSAETLDPRFAYGGMVGLLAALGDDRLVAL